MSILSRRFEEELEHSRLAEEREMAEKARPKTIVEKLRRIEKRMIKMMLVRRGEYSPNYINKARDKIFLTNLMNTTNTVFDAIVFTLEEFDMVKEVDKQ